MKATHMNDMLSTARPACLSLVAAITANMELLEYWLNIGAALVAIAAGALSIYRALRKPKPPVDGWRE